MQKPTIGGRISQSSHQKPAPANFREAKRRMTPTTARQNATMFDAKMRGCWLAFRLILDEACSMAKTLRCDSEQEDVGYYVDTTRLKRYDVKDPP